MKKHIVPYIALLLCLFASSPAVRADVPQEAQQPDYLTDYYMIVESASGGIDFYPDASFDAPRLNNAPIPNGTALHIEGEQKGKDGKDWGYIQYHGMYGYAPMDDLKPSTLSEAADSEYRLSGGAEADYDVEVDAEGGSTKLRQGPGEKFGEVPKAAEIPNGEKLHISKDAQTEDGSRWGMTTDGDTEGWVNLDDTKDAAETAKAAENTPVPGKEAENKAVSASGAAKDTPAPAEAAKNAVNPTEAAKNAVNPTGAVKNAVNPTEPAKSTPAPTEAVKNAAPPAKSAKDTPTPTEPAKDTVTPTEAAKNTVTPTEAAKDTPAPTEPAKDTVTPTEAAKNTVTPTEPAKDTPASTEPVRSTVAPTEPENASSPAPTQGEAQDASGKEVKSQNSWVKSPVVWGTATGMLAVILALLYFMKRKK